MGENDIECADNMKREGVGLGGVEGAGYIQIGDIHVHSRSKINNLK